MITLILPSRGNPIDAAVALRSFFAKANKPNDVQAIVRIDYDDPKRLEYNELMQFGKRVLIYLGKSPGYKLIFSAVAECADIATGDIIFVINDDLTMLTDGWDDKIAQVLRNNPLSVCTLDIQNPIPRFDSNYRFAFPVLTKQLWDIVRPAFIDWQFVTDRCFESYAISSNHEVSAGVSVLHSTKPATGEHAEYILDCHQRRTEFYVQKWKEVGRKMIMLVREYE